MTTDSFLPRDAYATRRPMHSAVYAVVRCPSLRQKPVFDRADIRHRGYPRLILQYVVNEFECLGK